MNERRSPVVLGIKGEPNRTGHFQWVTTPPTAGKTATLAYNKNAGQVRNGQGVVVHLGYDGWWEQDMQELPMKRLSDSQVCLCIHPSHAKQVLDRLSRPT